MQAGIGRAGLKRLPEFIERTRRHAAILNELLGGVPFPAIGELPYLLTLGGYGFLWLRLTDPTNQGVEG